MKILPAKIEHFELLDLRESECKSFALDPNSYAKTKALLDCSMCGTLIKDGIILAIFGYFELWPGVVEIWSFPSIHIKKYPIAYLKTLKQYLNQIIKDHSPHRVQSSAINDGLHDKWMRFLGFTKCGIMQKYSADQIDYSLWELIP